MDTQALARMVNSCERWLGVQLFCETPPRFTKKMTRRRSYGAWYVIYFVNLHLELHLIELERTGASHEVTS